MNDVFKSNKVLGRKSDSVKKPLETKETPTEEDGNDDNYGSSKKFVKLNRNPESEYIDRGD